MLASEIAAMNAIGASRNMLVPWYLMASFAYYELDMPLMSDATFDAICTMLDEEWDDLEHMHKPKVVRSQLQAGTCMIPRDQYPTIAKSAACGWLKMKLPAEDIPVPGVARAIRNCEFAIETLTGELHANRTA